MNNSEISPDELSLPACRQCQKPIEFPIDSVSLERFGQFVRLSCRQPGCGHVDWYKEAEFEATPSSLHALPDGTGEVWVHDVILGVSFKQTDDRA